jgi:hypothetical protein
MCCDLPALSLPLLDACTHALTSSKKQPVGPNVQVPEELITQSPIQHRHNKPEPGSRRDGDPFRKEGMMVHIPDTWIKHICYEK